MKTNRRLFGCFVAFVAAGSSVVSAELPQTPILNKPLKDMVIPNKRLPNLAPDFEVTINSVKFSCAFNDQTPFVTMSATIKNKGGPFDPAQTISWRWGVHNVIRTANNVGPLSSNINTPAGITFENLTIPLSWYEKNGKTGLTKLADPLHARATFEFDTTGKIAESNEGNNLSQIAVTIPAKLCP